MSMRGKTVADPHDQSWIDLVAKHGHAVKCVADAVDEPTDEPSFVYSTGGFESYGAPELIIFDLDHEVSIDIINDFMADWAAGRRYRCGEKELGLLGRDLPVVLLEAAAEKGTTYATYTDWYYERAAFPLWQLFWPAENGCFPWDADYPSDMAGCQPDLTERDFSGHPA